MTGKAGTVDIATALTVAWFGNLHTRVQADEVPAFLQTIIVAVEGLSGPAAGDTSVAVAEAEPTYTPKVSARKSLANPDFIISMLDGKAYKSLTRHIGAHGLSPNEYRARYGLKDSYPMVAANYSAARSELAKKIGFGRKPGQRVKKVAVEAIKAVVDPVKAATKRAKKTITEAKGAAKNHLGRTRLLGTPIIARRGVLQRQCII